MRFVQKHWKAFLVGIILVIGAVIYLSFHLAEVPLAVSATLVAVSPSIIYYVYTEGLDRPAVSIGSKDRPFKVAPMSAPSGMLEKLRGVDEFPLPHSKVIEEKVEGEIIETDSEKVRMEFRDQRVVRPAVSYRIKIENGGKATARNGMVQFKLESDEINHEFYGRWTDPGNSERYDLLPGQDHDVFLAKVFLTSDFFPSSPLIKEGHDFSVDKYTKSGFRVPLLGNPNGLIRPLSEIREKDFLPRTFIPREKRPEKKEKSIAGGWEGDEIGKGPHSTENKSYEIKARFIADNYKSGWEDLGTLEIPEDFVEASEDNKNWQEQWDIKLGGIRNQIIELAQNYSSKIESHAPS